MTLHRPKALDLFCGAGGAGLGLWRAGFDVVGIDIRPQPRYPFPFIQADAMEIDFRWFGLVWASPPCQAYTAAQRIQSREHPKLIEQVRIKLKESGCAYVIENVVGAPLKKPIELCGAMFGLKTYRHRIFETSFPCSQPWHPEHVTPQAKMGRKPKDGEFIQVVGNFSNVQAGRDAMDIDWMTRDELSEAIPPAYSEYIAKQFLEPHPRAGAEPMAEHKGSQEPNSGFDSRDGGQVVECVYCRGGGIVNRAPPLTGGVSGSET